MKRLLFLLLFITVTLQASLSEDKLKVMLIGKIAKYIVWDENSTSNELCITILKNPFEKIPHQFYKDKKIDGKDVKIKYIENIDELNESDILYIPSSESSQLQTILDSIKGKGIFVISDIRGFAQKSGMLQLYFVSRKIKLKINLQSVKEEHLNIRSTLLRIAKVIKEDR
jgi:hypothetical protein